MGLEKGAKPKDENDRVNILQPDLAKIFSNVKTVYMHTGWKQHGQYPFSLIAFLRLLQMTKWQKILIMTSESEDDDWISAVWKVEGSSIEKEYFSAHYNIEYVENDKG